MADDDVPRVDFAGRKFRTADTIGLMPWMRFSVAARNGLRFTDMDGMVACYELLRECIAPEDWEAFQRAATETKAQGDELLGVVRDVMRELTGRPTSRPSDSSDGPTATPPNSEGDSYLRVVRRLEEQGRPDQAAMVQMAAEARSPVSA
jgi:hypothetical protein